VKKLVEYRQMNLVKPWPIMPVFDVVFIRNVMIDFDVESKRGILKRIRQRLQPQGYLFLGTAETTINLDPEWNPTMVGKATVDQSRAAARRPGLNLAHPCPSRSPGGGRAQRRPGKPPARISSGGPQARASRHGLAARRRPSAGGALSAANAMTLAALRLSTPSLLKMAAICRFRVNSLRPRTGGDFGIRFSWATPSGASASAATHRALPSGSEDL
jgi:hypothetical protein